MMRSLPLASKALRASCSNWVLPVHLVRICPSVSPPACSVSVSIRCLAVG